MSNSLILESPPSTNTASNHQVNKQNPIEKDVHLPPIVAPPKLQNKLSEDDVADFMKHKHAQKFAADQGQGGIAEASIAEENEDFDDNHRAEDTDHDDLSEGDESTPHAQK